MAFIDKTIDIAADIRDVYAAWAAFEDYPTFMETIETVTVAEDDQLHWVAAVEDDTWEWDVDVVEHVPEEKIRWRAIDDRETGEVRFEKLAGDRTRLTYQLEYDPAAWEGGADSVRRWMNRRVKQDLEAFKSIVEAAEAT
jgi:uncharacterized membrane protein